MQIAPGLTLHERYTLQRSLGHGGTSTVWLARDTHYDRMLALKTLSPELAGAVSADRFLREIRVTSRLNHPAILPILDSGVLHTVDAGDIPWYAMPYVDGESLRVRLDRERQLPIDEALRITRAIGSALEAAHRENVVHRDIKPENILLSGDSVYVVDFGIAKALAETRADRLTSTGLAVGTPAYMSPEQAAADSVDMRSDQYSLASVLYEMIVGEPPFTGPTTAAVVARRFAERPRPLRTVRAAVPIAVEDATLRALERTPADRFQTITEFLGALRGGPTLDSRRDAARSRLPVAFMAIAVIAVTIGGVWAASSYLRTRRPARDPALSAELERGMREYDRRTPKGDDEAIRIFQDVLGRDSSYADAWNALAKAYIRANIRGFEVTGVTRDEMVPLAVRAVDRAVALDSNGADAWLTQAIVRASVDLTNEGPALEALRRSTALDSTNATAWQQLGVAHANGGNLDSALAAFRRGVRVAPTYAEGLTFLALGHYWRHAFDSAAFWVDSAVHVAPNYAMARLTKGEIAIERHDYASAESALEAARRLTSDVESLNAVLTEALAAATALHPGEARALLRTADSIAAGVQPLAVHPRLLFAQAYVRLGDRARALTLLHAYRPTRDLHFQLHLRCDPPFEELRTDPAFRALLVREAPSRGQGC